MRLLISHFQAKANKLTCLETSESIYLGASSKPFQFDGSICHPTGNVFENKIKLPSLCFLKGAIPFGFQTRVRRPRVLVPGPVLGRNEPNAP